MPELVGEERIAALEAENARLTAALVEARVHLVCQEIPGAHATQMPLHIVDQALAGDDSALKAMLREEHSKAIRALAEAWRKVVPEFVAHLQIEHLMQPLEPPSTAAEKIRAVFDALLENAREEGKQSMLCQRKAHQPYDALECPVCLAQERDSLRAQLAERDAQVERLRTVADDVVQGGGIADLEDAREVLNETPEQSLEAVLAPYKARVERLRQVLRQADCALASAGCDRAGPNRHAILGVLAETRGDDREEKISD